MERFLSSLALTLLFELPIAWAWGLRGRALAVVLVTNLMTNPMAVALHLAGVPQIPVEVGVVLTEAAVYRTFSRTPGWRVPRPVLLALVSNVLSWGLGLIIQL